MSVRNLGLILDNTLGMEKQVNSICKSFYYGIRNTGLIHKYINDETYKTLVQSLIISRLDYGNALLYNIPLSLTNCLQRVHNCAVRLVTGTHNREHRTPVLFQLHWLPVRFRSLYKIMFLTFKVLNGTAPVYLSDLIEKYILVGMLRSESYSLLRVPRSHTEMYRKRPFRASAPRLWNELPNNIKHATNKDIFCKVLKTHLFKLAYLEY